MSLLEGAGVGLADRRAERLARRYATLSMAYEAIVRIRERLPLLEELCRVLVEQAVLRMAWVGEVDDHGWIVPIARAGAVDGYLDDVRISVLDVAEGRGPTGTAARERRHMVVTDLATDERMAPWRVAALARGYRSSAAFPLVVDDRCAAVLTAYAPEPGFFDEQQVELFDRIAADLSFALEAMQRDERRRAAEAQLRSSEERFRAAAESMLDAFTILSPVRDDDGEITDFRYRYVNDPYCMFVGFDRGRLLGQRVGEVFPQFLGSERFEVYRRVALTGEPRRTDEVQLPSTWAGTALASRVFDTVITSMGEGVVVSVRDITERTEADRELQLRAELLDLAHDAVIVREPVESRVTFWNREAETIYGYSRPEAVGRTTHELLATGFPESKEAVDEAIAREGGWAGELRHTCKDGTVIVVSSRQALQRDADGLPVAIIELNSDITERKQAEQELRLRAELLDLAHDAVIVRDPVESRVTFWNREAEAIYGYSRPEAIGRVTHELLGTVFPESARAVDEALAREGGWAGELRHTCKDGTVIVVASRQALARDEDGRPLAIIALNSDITERKQAERELRLRAELLDLAHDAVIVLDPADKRVRFWNREAETIYGYSRADAVGGVTHELLGTVFPESKEAVDEALAREGGWVGELRHTCKDGTVIVVSSRQALARDADGQPVAIIELNSDITEQKRSEADLAYISGLLERTQVISKTGGWEYDLATRKLTRTGEVYRIFGDERMDPIQLDEAIARYGPESAPIVAAAFQRLVTEGEPYDLEVCLVRADGERIWVRVIGQPLFQDGRVVRVGGIVADVTDRRRAEEEIRTLNAELEQRVAARTAALERANRELETFAYSVSHDLRAPLRAVNAFSQLLLDDYWHEVGEEGRHYLERVHAGAARMGELIDAVLELSRLSRRPMMRVHVDLSALASEIVADLQSADPDRGVEVEIEGGLVAEADLPLVRSVLQNLLANAFKFTSQTAHARVHFGLLEDSGVPVYFVADNGAGFDMAHAKELFLPFHRLHQDREFPGEGIGLATVVRAVHRHGGVLWAYGAVNQGATFYFSLIAGARPPADAATGEDVIPEWRQAAPRTADE